MPRLCTRPALTGWPSRRPAANAAGDGKREHRGTGMPTFSASLRLLPGNYAVCRLPADQVVPPWVAMGEFASITRTEEELSIVCSEGVVPEGVRGERGWRALRV